MLDALLEKHQNVIVCTVYNRVPSISEDALAALALFNEVILEEAASKRLSIIDLRNVCQEQEDYSIISPIEPSAQGALKMVKLISQISNNQNINNQYSAIYL